MAVTAVTPLAGKANGIQLLSLNSLPIRAFHLTWMAFFAWFVCALLMPLVKGQLDLSM